MGALHWPSLSDVERAPPSVRVRVFNWRVPFALVGPTEGVPELHRSACTQRGVRAGQASSFPQHTTAKPERGGALISRYRARGREHGFVDEVLPAASWWVTLKESHFDIGTS